MGVKLNAKIFGYFKKGLAFSLAMLLLELIVAFLFGVTLAAVAFTTGISFTNVTGLIILGIILWFLVGFIIKGFLIEKLNEIRLLNGRH